ncbi:UvrD-helicase domain-containing protein [Anaeromyxobacter oryzae]|uniref:DNA 3'-5' helicase n=1 Tax=Anaeromyxobacter oryzae TaxID=2918170 RepID=A0ABM7WTW7_9BACT|nr:UvrD-helicase domain-containing protein [Anaeromyxobacter oryzae]BDG02919.1 DNA helicase [Anaeromyxobacter oryzae]
MTVHVVSASAGTGKTFHLTGAVRDALLAPEASPDRARPEGVVAITYTRKAAAELESRIRTDLIRAGRGDLAARVRDGYLGTVHSVCERLLRELALEAGHSPFLEPIAEPQRERLFAEALAAVLAGREAPIERIASRFQLEGWETGPLRKIVELARENGLDGAGLRAAGERSLAALAAVLPPISMTGEEYLERLGAEAREADRRLRALNRAGKAAGARRDAVADLVRALDRGLPPWATQLKAVRQEWTGAEQPLVAGLLETVPWHLSAESFHADLTDLTRELFAVAADALDAYAEAKQAARVVDFQDMLALAARLLEDAGVAASLAGKLDLVVVDEFQDTSPMQLAVVSALERIARRSVWVGDRKQAIFGFQGSDPVLMGEAMAHALGGREPEFLSESWRSRRPLVDFTSELFAHALAPHGFDEREVRITTPAERPDPPALRDAPVLECWSWDGNGEPHAVADGVFRLLAEAPPVREKDTGVVRPLRRKDVAVLARRNEDCRAIASALRARGIPARLELADLAQTPEAILVRSAVALVADPADGVAAMDVSYLSGGAADPDAWLSARLVEAARDRAARASAEAVGAVPPGAALPFSDDARVAALRTLHERARSLAPAEALDAALAAAAVLELLRTWPDPAQRLANVEALRGAARAYENLCRVRRCAATVAGLVEHLATLAEQKDADYQAVPGTEDAVTLSTWHSAKGLEWPVVVLASLAFAKDRDPWDACIERPERFDPARPLAGRWVRWWPWPYGKLSAGLELADRVDETPSAAALREDDARERVRLLYVVFTRARDRLVLAAGVKKGAPCVAALEPLRDVAGQPVLAMPFGAVEGMAVARAGTVALPCRVRALSGAEVEPQPVAAAARPWYDGAPSVIRGREVVNPSNEPVAASEPGRIVAVTPLAGRAPLRDVADMGALGDAVHAFLAADRRAGDREAVAARLLAAYGVAGTVAPASLVHASDALRAFLEARYPGAAWRREWPVRARLVDRGEPRLLQGEVDLFLERPDGFVLVDHKSFPGNDRERDERVVAYAAQLGLYAFVLERALGKPLLAAFIHLPIRGEIVEVDVGRVVEEWRERSTTAA